MVAPTSCPQPRIHLCPPPQFQPYSYLWSRHLPSLWESHNNKQGNRRLHFTRGVHSRHPFPLVGDAAYRQRGEGPSHVHGQHAQKKLVKTVRVRFWRYLCGQTDTLTDILITIHRNRYRGRSNNVLKCLTMSYKMWMKRHTTTTATTVLWSFFWDHRGEPVPEENFWTLWCEGRLTEADTPTIRLGATPSGLSSAQPTSTIPHFLQAGCPSCRPTNSVKALKATSAFGLGRRR